MWDQASFPGSLWHLFVLSAAASPVPVSSAFGVCRCWSNQCWDWRHKHLYYRSGCIFAREIKRVAGLGWAQSKPQLPWSIQIARKGRPNYQQLTAKRWLIPHSLPGWSSFSSCCFPCSHGWDSSSACPAPPALITSAPAQPSVKIPGGKALCEQENVHPAW